MLPRLETPAWVRALIEQQAVALARFARARGLSAHEGFVCVEDCLRSFIALPQAPVLARQPSDAGQLMMMMMSAVVRSTQAQGVPSSMVPSSERELMANLVRLTLLVPRLGVCAELGVTDEERERLLSACFDDLRSNCGPSSSGLRQWEGDLAAFDAQVASGTLLVHCSAPWCLPCQLMVPVLDELAHRHREWLRVVELDVDQHPVLAARYRVRALPTLLLFQEGELIETQVGFSSANHLQMWLDRAQGEPLRKMA